jgi:hypothetical protein
MTCSFIRFAQEAVIPSGPNTELEVIKYKTSIYQRISTGALGSVGFGQG